METFQLYFLKDMIPGNFTDVIASLVQCVGFFFGKKKSFLLAQVHLSTDVSNQLSWLRMCARAGIHMDLLVRSVSYSISRPLPPSSSTTQQARYKTVADT